MKRLFREPERDPELADALRRIERHPLEDETSLLRRRIAAAARPGLAVLATPAPHWWEFLTGWGRLAVPVALAVALAAVLLMPFSNENGASPNYSDAGADTTLVLAAFSEGAGGQLANLIAPVSHDWLLEQAISQ